MVTTASDNTAGRRRVGRTELGHQLDWLMRCVKRRRHRMALVKLSDLVLRDIGLTRIDVAMEADKPFWRP
jgi:uncharacterized protein YjiS (DUF1127 family)